MLYILIFYDFNDNCKFHIFSSKEKAEEWVEHKYLYQIVPEYLIKEINIDPSIFDEFNYL